MSEPKIVDESIPSVDQKQIADEVIVKKPVTKTSSFFNVMFSGFALLSDGYQSGVISFVNLFLGKIYGSEDFNSEMKSRLSYSLFVGAIVGQIGITLT